jgi:hypothetical protein
VWAEEPPAELAVRRPVPDGRKTSTVVDVANGAALISHEHAAGLHPTVVVDVRRTPRPVTWEFAFDVFLRARLVGVCWKTDVQAELAGEVRGRVECGGDVLRGV